MPAGVIQLVFGLFKFVILLAALGAMFNSAAVLHKPEGNYDAEAKLSARIVFVICVVVALWAGASLFHMAFSPGG
jgi:hypothetical protein